MKKLLFLFLSFLFITYSKQEYILNANTNGQTITTCSGLFLDTGGPGSNYNNNEDYTITICPDAPNSLAQATFLQFQTEANRDRLYVFDGPDTNSPLIVSPNPGGSGPCNNLPGGWWGNQLAGMSIIATNPSGCLTFRFCSDGSITQAGWVASIECISTVSSHFVIVQPFLDSNNNGIRDTGEPNFSFGELNYEVNNNGIIHQSYSPSGSFNFYVSDFTTPTVYDFTSLASETFFKKLPENALF